MVESLRVDIFVFMYNGLRTFSGTFRGGRQNLVIKN